MSKFDVNVHTSLELHTKIECLPPKLLTRSWATWSWLVGWSKVPYIVNLKFQQSSWLDLMILLNFLQGITSPFCFFPYKFIHREYGENEPLRRCTCVVRLSGNSDLLAGFREFWQNIIFDHICMDLIQILKMFSSCNYY